jgi:hypothetical protein
MLAWARNELQSSRNAMLVPSPYRGCILVLMLVVLAGTVAPAAGQPESQPLSQPQSQGVARPDGLVDFDIPAQPLSKALYTFSAATGIEVLVDARQAAGRRSADIKGLMTPRDALAMLLMGSELVTQEFGPNTVTLKTKATALSGMPPDVDTSYFADIQRAVQQALCSDARTAPGRYRLALKLWIGQSGTVLRSKRLDTTGDDNLDGVLDVATQAIRIGRPPPRDLPQPVTLVVSPRQGTTNCPSGASDLRRASSR